MSSRCTRCAWGVLFASVSLVLGQVNNTWNGGAGNGNWFTDGNWSAGHAPLAGEAVSITSGAGNVRLTNVTPWLASLVISNKTLTCSNWFTAIRATNVTVRNLGILTTPSAFTTNQMSNRVWVSCVNLTLDPGGKIDVNARGYASDNGPGRGSGGWHASGGGYGGLGGLANNASARWGMTYGAASTPTAPGSGGGGVGAGAGGGAIRIDATGTVTVNGTLTANGAVSSSYGYGGGSGGGILIACSVFGGTAGGLLSANGTNTVNSGWHSGAGGGGRIAVSYTSLASPHAARFSAAAGNGGWADSYRDLRDPWAATHGTVWFSNTNMLAGVIKDSLIRNATLVIPGFTAWALPSLVISNSSFQFDADNFQLTVSGDLKVYNGWLGIGGSNGNASLRCGGNLVLTNGGSLYLYSGMNLGSGYGAVLGVTNTLSMGANSWIYPYCHPSNGAAVLIRTSNLTVRVGGGINANAKGYGNGLGPGTPVNTWHSGGAGYGGWGGMPNNAWATGGVAYGSVSLPLVPGSCGSGYGAGYAVPYGGGYGGGVIRIEAAGTVALHGTLTANGGISHRYGFGGGSGGSIYVRCRTLEGSTNGLVRANGEAIDPNGAHSGCGGGGRIAMAYGQATLPCRVRFQCSPGNTYGFLVNDPDNWYGKIASQGTLWLTNTALLSESLVANQFRDVDLYMSAGITNWRVGSLTVSNCSVVFMASNMTVTVTNDIVVRNNGGLGIRGTLRTLQGNLLLTNNSRLYAYAGRTNGTGRDYSTVVSVAGRLYVSPGCWVFPRSHQTDGGAPMFRVGALHVATNAGFNANSGGYVWTRGPGGVVNTWHASGAGYGGKGGKCNGAVAPGNPYGTAEMPISSGSGGGHTSGGIGGGVVRVIVNGQAAVYGTLKANGGNSHGYGSGGGSGGTVWLACSRLVSGVSASLEAKGGSVGFAAYHGGGGGGGRVALWYNYASPDIIRNPTPFLAAGCASYLGAVSVTNGIGYYVPPDPNAAASGTIRYLKGPTPGGLFLFQ